MILNNNNKKVFKENKTNEQQQKDCGTYPWGIHRFTRLICEPIIVGQCSERVVEIHAGSQLTKQGARRGLLGDVPTESRGAGRTWPDSVAELGFSGEQNTCVPSLPAQN